MFLLPIYFNMFWYFFSDAELELIRQRALNSMLQNQQQRRESEEKKILIPLNEETSDDDDDLSLSSNGSFNRKEQPLQVNSFEIYNAISTSNSILPYPFVPNPVVPSTWKILASFV